MYNEGMKRVFPHIGFLRTVLVCLVLTMITIIAVFGVYFATEKVTVLGASSMEEGRLTYRVTVNTQGKYTLKRAMVQIHVFDAQGQEIETYTEIVRHGETVEKTISAPEGCSLVSFDIKKYTLNNTYEIIVMCLCCAVLITAVTYFGISFMEKKPKPEEES